MSKILRKSNFLLLQFIINREFCFVKTVWPSHVYHRRYQYLIFFLFRVKDMVKTEGKIMNKLAPWALGRNCSLAIHGQKQGSKVNEMA